MKIGLFYGSSTCYTEMTAEKIKNLLDGEQLEVFNIADTDIKKIEDFQYLIFGIPTWDYGELQEDWEEIWDDIDELNLEGRHFAIFGQGDQIGYPQWFLDAMGFLHDKLVNLGAHAHGYWPVDGFEFEESKALTADETQFVGLALDDENEFNLSEARIKAWCEQILIEFNA